MRRLVAAAVLLAACSSGPRGLGKAACPYLRPRLIRVDTDLAGVAAGRAGAADDLAAVAADLADYVKTNLPHGGKARSDRPVVTLNGALKAVARDPAGPTGALLAAERSLRRECRVGG